MGAPSSRNSRTYPSGSGASAQAWVEALQGLRAMSLRVVRQSLQHADLEETSGASGCLGGAVQPDQQPGGLVGGAGVRVCPVLREEQTREREVVEFAQIADIVRGGDASVTCPVGGLGQPALRNPDRGPSSPRWVARQEGRSDGTAAPPGRGG